MKSLNDKLLKVEQIAGLSKFRRFLHQPVKYVIAVGYRTVFYPMIKKGIAVKTTTFFNAPISVSLPAGTDIYLTGGKSHPSEIKLAKFIIKNLSAGDCFIDVGAHYGYFTLLVASIVGKKGTVLSFEPSKQNYGILLKNTSAFETIRIYDCAVSDTNQDLIFYEFPALYSEYSTATIEQFKNELWFLNNQPVERKVTAITLDEVIQSVKLIPKIIKIDVEGGEYKVIKGMAEFLSGNNCLVVLEYLTESRHNEAHRKAVELLKEFGFSSYVINHTGDLELVDDPSTYLTSANIESENFVFKRPGMQGETEN